MSAWKTSSSGTNDYAQLSVFRINTAPAADAAVSTVPQTMSTIENAVGQFFTVAMFVRSYVPYATNPSTAPTMAACIQSPLSRCGATAKKLIPTE